MELSFATRGGGPDLVLLHGWGMTAEVWSDTATALAQQYRVHSVELPGHGASAPCAPYALDDLAGALAAAFSRPVALCGWSLGGQIALQWALRAPRQVGRLVLVATTPCFVNHAHWDHGIDAAVFDAFLRELRGNCAGVLRRFAALQALGDADARAVLRRLREPACAAGGSDVESLAAGLTLLGQTDLRESLSRVTQRTLILHGERDRLVPLAAGRYLQRTLPDAKLDVIAGAAHAPFILQPQRMAQRILGFLQ